MEKTKIRKSSLKHPVKFGRLTLYFTDEEYEQYTVVEWLRHRHLTNKKVWSSPLKFISVPNEKKVSLLHGFKINQLGRSKGFPDMLIFSLPRSLSDSGFKGLAIEMKSLTGKPTPEQRQWMVDLDALGWHCYWFQGAEVAIEKLIELGY